MTGTECYHLFSRVDSAIARHLESRFQNILAVQFLCCYSGCLINLSTVWMKITVCSGGRLIWQKKKKHSLNWVQPIPLRPRAKQLRSGTVEHNNVSWKHMQKMGKMLFLYLSWEEAYVQIVSYSHGCDGRMHFSALYIRRDFKKYSRVQEKMSVVLATCSVGSRQGVLSWSNVHVV